MIKISSIKEEKLERLDDIWRRFSNELGKYQQSLTLEEIHDVEYRKRFMANFIMLIYNNVGRDFMVHYLIELLNAASKFELLKNNKKMLKQREKEIKQAAKTNKKFLLKINKIIEKKKEDEKNINNYIG